MKSSTKSSEFEQTDNLAAHREESDGEEVKSASEKTLEYNPVVDWFVRLARGTGRIGAIVPGFPGRAGSCFRDL